MFSENLKRLRKERGFTQESLAIQLNVVRQTVSKWEKGLSVPDAVMLQRLAEVLEVSVSQLLGAEIPEGESQRNEIAELLSKINEQLAIRNRRGRLALRIALIALAALIVVPLVGSALLGVLNEPDPNQNVSAGTAHWVCTIDGYEYDYKVTFNNKHQVIEEAIESEDGAPKAFDPGGVGAVEEYEKELREYYQTYSTSRGGTIELVETTGMPLKFD